jgi:predicted enzyme related to lactoylglutathione lyase
LAGFEEDDMNRPIHFEIPAEKPERAMKFYEKVFGWKFEKWGGPMEYWVIRTGEDGTPGINGGLMPRRDPAQPCVNTMDVPDLDATIGMVESTGGQCAVPKMPIPGVGWLAYFKDTEGHIFGAMQPDPGAK